VGRLLEALQTSRDSARAPRRYPPGRVVGATTPGGRAASPKTSTRGETAICPRALGGRNNNDNATGGMKKGCVDKSSGRQPWTDMLLLPGSTQPVWVAPFPGAHTGHTKGNRTSTQYGGLEQRYTHKVAPLLIKCDNNRYSHIRPTHTEPGRDADYEANPTKADTGKSASAENGLLKRSKLLPVGQSQYTNHIDIERRSCVTFDNSAYEDESELYAEKIHCTAAPEGVASRYNRHIHSTNL